MTIREEAGPAATQPRTTHFPRWIECQAFDNGAGVVSSDAGARATKRFSVMAAACVPWKDKARWLIRQYVLGLVHGVDLNGRILYCAIDLTLTLEGGLGSAKRHVLCPPVRNKQYVCRLQLHIVRLPLPSSNFPTSIGISSRLERRPATL